MTEFQRAWAAIGCDARPYTVGQRVLKNVNSCSTCESDFLSEEELVAHCLNKNRQCNAKQCRKYKDIVFVPGIECYLHFFFFVVDVAQNYYVLFLNLALIHFIGLGHYEINMIKAPYLNC